MVRKDLLTEFHRQETPEYCGATCAQMILHQLDSSRYIDQLELYRYIDNNKTESGWAADPGGLNNALNFYDVRPAFRFDIISDTDIDIITRKIVWTIFRWKVAPVVLIWGGTHWVLITGYVATADPVSIGDTSYTIETLIINNPGSVLPNSFVPPHFNLDLCNTDPRGTVSELEIESNAGGRTVRWQEDYLIPVESLIAPSGSNWIDKYVTICDPELPPKTHENPIVKRYRNSAEKIITKKMATEFAMAAIKKKILKNNNKDLAKLLEKTDSGEPELVMRIDEVNNYYYIVPVITNNNKNFALIRIDAQNGDLRESAFAKNKNHPLLFKPLTPQQIITAIGNKIKFGKKETVTIYPEGLNISSILVWEPCVESFTPYFPFHLVHYGKKRIYVRIDGAVFTKLTTKARGM